MQKDQFDAALAYLGNVGDQPIDWKKFEEEHGVDVEVGVFHFMLQAGVIVRT